MSPIYQTVLQKDLKSKVKNTTVLVLEANMGELLYSLEWGSLSNHDLKSKRNKRKTEKCDYIKQHLKEEAIRKVTQQKTPEAKSKDKHQTLRNTICN